MLVPPVRLALLLCLTLGLAAVFGVPSPSARAVPIGVRAKTNVSLEHRRDGKDVTLLGRLVDDRDAPIVGENTILEVDGLDPVTRITDDDGHFEVKLTPAMLSRLAAMHGQRLPWTVRFDGSSRLGAAESHGTLDLSKIPTRLDVNVAEREVNRDDRNIAITLALTATTRVPQPLADAEVQLRVGSGEALTGRTGSTGRVTFVVRPTLLEGAGTYAIVARFAGDPQYAGSEGRAELKVSLSTRLSLHIAREGDARQARYRFSGRLTDENGPIADSPVVIMGVPAPPPPPRKGAPVKSAESPRPIFEVVAATDRDGIFVAALPADALYPFAEQIVIVRAAFEPPARDVRHRGVESRPVHLEIPPPPGVPIGWYALGLGIVVSFMALAHALRTRLFARAWAQLVLALRAFRLRFKKPLADQPAGSVEPPFVTPVEDADPSRARLRDVFSGAVIDVHKRHPLAGASVLVRGEGGVVMARTNVDSAGRFALGPVAPGACVLRVEARGYLPREIALSVPHAGDYDGAYYALVSVKRRIRDLFGEATSQLGAPVAWGFDTPREASGRALTRSASPLVLGLPLGELTNIVERAHFAPEGVDESDVERARSLREELS